MVGGVDSTASGVRWCWPTPVAVWTAWVAWLAWRVTTGSSRRTWRLICRNPTPPPCNLSCPIWFLPTGVVGVGVRPGETLDRRVGHGDVDAAGADPLHGGFIEVLSAHPFPCFRMKILVPCFGRRWHSVSLPFLKASLGDCEEACCCMWLVVVPWFSSFASMFNCSCLAMWLFHVR